MSCWLAWCSGVWLWMRSRATASAVRAQGVGAAPKRDSPGGLLGAPLVVLGGEQAGRLGGDGGFLAQSVGAMVEVVEPGSPVDDVSA